jgi:hypothetical protein
MEVAALADLRDPQLDLARPGVPPPPAIAVAMRHAILGALTMRGADQLTNLHQLLSDHLEEIRREEEERAGDPSLRSPFTVLGQRPVPGEAPDHDRGGQALDRRRCAQVRTLIELASVIHSRLPYASQRA